MATTSLVADLIAQKLGNYVVTESGFGSDMGMEKFMDIVCRVGGIQPTAVVLTVTVRAVKHHGGIPDGQVTGARGRQAIAQGMANVRRHFAIVREFGLPCVVAVNRRPGDTDAQIKLVRELARESGAHAASATASPAAGRAPQRSPRR
jgi:formate--tetrahydrofolate ligase